MLERDAPEVVYPARRPVAGVLTYAGAPGRPSIFTFWLPLDEAGSVRAADSETRRGA